MSKQRANGLRRGGAYTVKAAESRPRQVTGKSGKSDSAPTNRDRKVVDDLVKFKTA